MVTGHGATRKSTEYTFYSFLMHILISIWTQNKPALPMIIALMEYLNTDMSAL